ncbi:MAG: hypothetical protein EOO99_09425 [Pedobacter sp.]|nr:MAG: hypothetical protein EOO99_09425 [Pedobacter sp.]
MYGLKKLHYQISIQAPTQTVWETLWNKTSYEQWTAAFGKGSTYKGHIAKGERIHFLNPENSGIYSDLIYCKPPYHAIFQHIGEIDNGIEQALNAATEKWTGVYESYELKEVSGITTLKVEVETEPEGVASFNNTFPEALNKLKHLIENKS